MEHVETVVIGGGQAGLSVGYHLQQRGRPFVILDSSARVGDSWRRRWDSLRLFTPARFDGIVGMRFPAPPWSFPTKDELADYLERYAAHFKLPVRTGVRVDRLTRDGRRYVLDTGERRIIADHVVVAMATYQVRRVPAFARELDPGIVQLHSSEYRNPGQLRPGNVLIAGAGNSGAEIAKELSRSHTVLLSGRGTGHVPFRIDGFGARFVTPVLFRIFFHRVLTTATPLGRKLRPKVLTQGGPLIRVKPKDLAAAGVERLPRVAGVQRGRPQLDDGRVLDVTNVIWCTGFNPGFSWIDLPILDGAGEPRHTRGVVPGEPGLYFVGLHFLYAFSSTMIHGLARDAEHVVNVIDDRIRAAASETSAANAPSPSPGRRSSQCFCPGRSDKLSGRGGPL